MQVIPYAIMAVGTVAQMAGSLSTASQARREAKQTSRAIDIAGELRRGQERREYAKLLAKNQARTEAGGVAAGSGSPLEADLANASTAGWNLAIDEWEDQIKKRQVRGAAQKTQREAYGNVFGGLTQLASIGGKWWTQSRGSESTSTYAPGTYMYPNSPFP